MAKRDDDWDIYDEDWMWTKIWVAVALVVVLIGGAALVYKLIQIINS